MSFYLHIAYISECIAGWGRHFLCYVYCFIGHWARGGAYWFISYTERIVLSVLPQEALTVCTIHRALSSERTAARGLFVYTRTQSAEL